MRRLCARQRQRHDHPHNRMMTKAKPLPSLQVLNELFRYEADTGSIFWRAKRGKIRAGQPAGTIGESGYLRIAFTINKKYCVFNAHRIIWYIATGQDPLGFQIDHIDGNRLNNRIANLRLASNADNQRNRGASPKNTSGYKGVSYHKQTGRWCSAIKYNNKQIWLGRFDCPELAHMAYCKAAAELHGEFARGA
jgi:hypothetical protein